MEVAYNRKALDDLKYWKSTGNKIIQAKITALIKDIQVQPFKGIGKPEGLKHQLTGKWARRINSEHRIIYAVAGNTLQIYSLKGHY